MEMQIDTASSSTSCPQRAHRAVRGTTLWVALGLGATLLLSACGGESVGSDGTASAAAAATAAAATATAAGTAAGAAAVTSVGTQSTAGTTVSTGSGAGAASGSSSSTTSSSSSSASSASSSSSSASSRASSSASSSATASSSGTSTSGTNNGCANCSTILQARYLDPGKSTVFAYYDPALNITWLQNANAGSGSAFDDGRFANDGRMTWDSAQAWAASLSYGAPGAGSGWRMPKIDNTGGLSCVFSMTGGTACGQNVVTTPGARNYSEMAHMFQVTLGNSPAFNGSGGLNPGPWLRSSGPFTTLQQGYNVVWYGSPSCDADRRNCRDDAYWTNQTDTSSGGVSAWKFLMGEGEQIGDAKNVEFFAWAVHDGDVGYP